ncbi:hypothetical protein B0H14DRAFT_2604950 [Mycena olivaceomarginata]|nr:hypothetical protein B0H14DRAFT_2604950 [Mycena olivaceomarginata]
MSLDIVDGVLLGGCSLSLALPRSHNTHYQSDCITHVRPTGRTIMEDHRAEYPGARRAVELHDMGMAAQLFVNTRNIKETIGSHRIDLYFATSFRHSCSSHLKKIRGWLYASAPALHRLPDTWRSSCTDLRVRRSTSAEEPALDGGDPQCRIDHSNVFPLSDLCLQVFRNNEERRTLVTPLLPGKKAPAYLHSEVQIAGPNCKDDVLCGLGVVRRRHYGKFWVGSGLEGHR